MFRIRSPASHGFVTAETAVSIPALVVVLVVALVAVGASAAQLRCAAAAREAARALARGESVQTARAAALSAAPPGAGVTMQRSGDLLRVMISAPVRMPGPVFHGVGWTVHADAATAAEPS
jgi:hypothetical protein